MPTEFKIPELGENVSAGDVVRILVKAGDTLEKDQAVLELETDKATIEVPSNVSGTVAELKIKAGDKVKVGQVVLTLSDGAATAGGEGKEAAKAEATAGAKAEPAPAAAKKTEREPADARTDAAPRPEADRPARQPLGGPEDGGLSQAAVPGRVAEDEPEPDDEGLPAVAQRPRGEVVDINRGARAAA